MQVKAVTMLGSAMPLLQPPEQADTSRSWASPEYATRSTRPSFVARLRLPEPPSQVLGVPLKADCPHSQTYVERVEACEWQCVTQLMVNKRPHLHILEKDRELTPMKRESMGRNSSSHKPHPLVAPQAQGSPSSVSSLPIAASTAGAAATYASLSAFFRGPRSCAFLASPSRRCLSARMFASSSPRLAIIALTARWMSTGGGTDGCWAAPPCADAGLRTGCDGWVEGECGLPGERVVVDVLWGVQAVATARRMRASQNPGKRISSGLAWEQDSGLAVALAGRWENAWELDTQGVGSRRNEPVHAGGSVSGCGR